MAINHRHERPNRTIKMTLGARTVLSSLFCDYRTSCFVARGEVLEMESEKEKREREESSAVHWSRARERGTFR